MLSDAVQDFNIALIYRRQRKAESPPITTQPVRTKHEHPKSNPRLGVSMRLRNCAYKTLLPPDDPGAKGEYGDLAGQRCFDQNSW